MRRNSHGKWDTFVSHLLTLSYKRLRKGIIMIRMEMKRAFHNRNFYIALIIGCGIAIGQYIQNVLPMIKYLPMDVEKGVYPHSVFNKWIGGEYHTLWPMLFYFILPVLAALPHGDSYYQDIQSGYVQERKRAVI